MNLQTTAQTVAKHREAQMQLCYDSAPNDFKECASDFIRSYALTHDVFTTENVSDAYISARLPPPADLRAWAGITRKAKSDGVIAYLDGEGWSWRRASKTLRYRSLVCQAVAA